MSRLHGFPRQADHFFPSKSTWTPETQPNDDLQPFLRQMEHFLTDMSNRVEHQKLNQVTAELPPGWVFGVQLGLRQTQALINTYHIILIHHHRHVIHHRFTGNWSNLASWITFQWIVRWWMTWNEYDVFGINQCLCLPEAELNTKNSTRWQLCCHLVEFLGALSRSVWYSHVL